MFKTDFEMGYRDNAHGSIESCFFYYFLFMLLHVHLKSIESATVYCLSHDLSSRTSHLNLPCMQK